MPCYEYHCLGCHSEFEELVNNEQSVSCPYCGSLKLQKKMSAPNFLKGRQAPPSFQPNHQPDQELKAEKVPATIHLPSGDEEAEVIRLSIAKAESKKPPDLKKPWLN